MKVCVGILDSSGLPRGICQDFGVTAGLGQIFRGKSAQARGGKLKWGNEQRQSPEFSIHNLPFFSSHISPPHIYDRSPAWPLILALWPRDN